MKNRLIKISSFLVIFMALPLAASAATTHHYVCADLSITAGSPTCSNDVWTFTNVEIQTVADTGGAVFDLQGTDWYVSATVTATENLGISFLCDNYPTTCSLFRKTTTFVDEPYSVAGGTATGFDMTNNQGGAVYNNGVVAELCISDTVGACSSTATATSTTTDVDSAVDDLYHGVVLFLIGFWGVIWFFRKNR